MHPPQEGTFAANNGSTSCTTCPDGYMQQATGASQCIACAAGAHRTSGAARRPLVSVCVCICLRERACVRLSVSQPHPVCVCIPPPRAQACFLHRVQLVHCAKRARTAQKPPARATCAHQSIISPIYPSLPRRRTAWYATPARTSPPSFPTTPIIPTPQTPSAPCIEPRNLSRLTPFPVDTFAC